MILIQNSTGLLDWNERFHAMVHRVLTHLLCENITTSSVKNMNNKFYAIANHKIDLIIVCFVFLSLSNPGGLRYFLIAKLHHIFNSTYHRGNLII